MRTPSSPLNAHLIAIAASLAALACMPAQAQQGPYVGGNLGAARLKGDDAPNVPTDRSSTGYKLYAGYGLHPNFALETGWTDTGRFDSSAGTLRAQGVFLDGVGKLPLARDFSLLGRLGVFHGRLKDGRNGGTLSETDTNIKGGLGVQYDFTKNSAIRAEWERYRFDAPNNGTAKTDLFSLGYKYQF